MKRTALGLATAALLVAASAAPHQEADLATRVKALEDEVKGLRATVAALEAGQAEQTRAVAAFFTAQSKSTAALRDSLSSSEEHGFTAGINPKSREVLLAGFRSYLDTIEGALPARSKREGEKKEPGGDTAPSR